MCNPTSMKGHKHVIMVMDYITKWVESISTFNNHDETSTCFIFNHIIARFGVPKVTTTVVIYDGFNIQAWILTRPVLALLSTSEWTSRGCQ